MSLRGALVLVLLSAPFVAACGSETAVDGSTRAADPHNANTPTQGIGPSGNVGASPRDMAGGGRGSLGPHGR
ncbi:MAG TPA: hypothetical protein VGL81_14155 [Polyangiaceae bacterium]|jgi:hypothetical protein